MLKLIRYLRDINSDFHCVATIGNFDGVHRGHQKLLEQLISQAKRRRIPSCLITFEPQPNEFFSHAAVPARLTKFREKFELLKQFELDYLVCLRFNEELACMTAEQFIDDILVNKLNIKHLIIGDDFRFGYKRCGDAAILASAGKEHGFTVEEMPTFTIGEERVSSSRIRTALNQGELAVAQHLLGWPYRLRGRVSHGRKLGRKLGFPTANVHLNRKVVPVSGIFAVKIFNLTQQPLYGVANIGNRPAVGGGRTLLEVYIFDFNETIYGCPIEVELVKKLRDEENYSSLEALQQQIAKDVLEARAIFFQEH